MTAARTGKRRAYAPRVPPEQRRAELLDAALHLVVTEGHNAATMDAVAEQAGVTKPVVYGQFANRAELLAALLQREQEQALAQLLAVLPLDLDGPPDDPAELLGRVLADFLRAVRAAPHRWHCIVMPMADMPADFHAAREQARAVALTRAEVLATWVLSAIDAPAELDAEIVAHTVVNLCEMAARLVLTDPAHFRPERFVAAMQAAVGLTRRPPSG
jgi:AcrR family transcriptional regulator